MMDHARLKEVSMLHKKVTYSLPNLKNLVDVPNSCVYCVENCKKTLTIFPMHLDNIKASVNELLQAKVTTYDSTLKGIILGHKNIKVFNQLQLNDDGNFGLDYSADIYLFKPEDGQLLTGEVNKKSKDHIGVLVHYFFNASIPRPRNDYECPKNWMGFEINIGQPVTFEVVKVNFSGRMPFIKGKLIEFGEHDTEDKDSGIGGHDSMEESSIIKDELESPDVSTKDVKKKKKKKSKKKSIETLDFPQQEDMENLLEVDELNSQPLVDVDQVNDVEESPKKKKKGKKRKCSEVDTEIYVEPSCDVNTDEYLESKSPEKKKKKKKHSN